jgi:exodeoxyribonuclease III
VQALDLGAADYVTKPFGMDELLARMRTALRHQLQVHGERPVFRTVDLSVDLVRRLVRAGDKDVKLSLKEYDLLRVLVQYAGKVLTHKFLLGELWDDLTDAQYLRVHVRQLRQKGSATGCARRTECGSAFPSPSGHTAAARGPSRSLKTGPLQLRPRGSPLRRAIKQRKRSALEGAESFRMNVSEERHPTGGEGLGRVLDLKRGLRRETHASESRSDSAPMKIATFNINNINKRLFNLLTWLRVAQPDVVCLQELKATDAAFPIAAIRRSGYEAVWRGQKSWNGVAILARGMEPILTRMELPGDPTDKQSRYIEAAVNGVLIGCLYLPNGNPQPGPKFDYKLAWFARLLRHAKMLRRAGVPMVLAGDYNVVPTERDIYPTKSYDKDALLQPETRAAFRGLLGQGWVDAIRTLYPEQRIYTFWDYKRNRWPRDAGLRIDHILLSRDLAKGLVAAGVDRAVRGKANASDHAPVWAELRIGKSVRETAKTQVARSRSKPPAKPSRERRPLLVIDGDSFAHRAYHALPKSILRRGGKPAGAILGFANMLLRFYQAERPRAVLVAWDTLDAPTYRNKAFPAYQSGRQFDDALIEQLAILPEFVAACGFANAKAPGYEADDFLASAVAAEERRKGTVLVASGDRDTFQLASNATTILYPIRAGELARIDPAQVRARYGVNPEQVPDFIALRGDPSDKLPGAPGVGAAGAASLLRKYGTLEKALAAGRFSAHAERLRLFRTIAMMDAKAPLPPLRNQKPTWTGAAALVREWQLKQLAGRLKSMSLSSST